MDEDEVRAKAHERNDLGRDPQYPSRDKYYRAMHYSRQFGDPLFRDKVAGLIDSIPLNPAMLKHCPACEGVLCGLCGQCHELDRQDWHNGRDCPAVQYLSDEGDCVVWASAYIFLKDADKSARSKT